jgi:hypothetical protein
MLQISIYLTFYMTFIEALHSAFNLYSFIILSYDPVWYLSLVWFSGWNDRGRERMLTSLFLTWMSLKAINGLIRLIIINDQTAGLLPLTFAVFIAKQFWENVVYRRII